MMLSVIVLSFLSLLSHFVASAPTGEFTATRGGGFVSRRSFVCTIPYLSDYIGCDSPDIPVIVGGFGTARGVKVGNDVVRFVVQYATAERFADPVRVKRQWNYVNNDPAALPPACPQPNLSASQYSEQCLYAVMYVPETSLAKIDWEFLPTYVWIHGGSFIAGSASDPGLDAAKLAASTNSIVIVLQYRLGLLGYLPPSSAPGASGNLGVKDVIAALDFVRHVVFWFGGDPSKVTVGGHSSGSHIVRALLASPSASSLFDGATLFGDPINYGFLKTTAYQTMQNCFWNNPSPTASCPVTSLSPSDSVANLITAQNAFFSQAAGLDPSIGPAVPYRPTKDGSLLTTGLTTSLPSHKKPLWISTNKNEAGTSFGNIQPGQLPLQYYPSFVISVLGAQRGQLFLDSPYYNPNSNALLEPYNPSSDAVIQALDRGGTDQQWKCAGWDLARRWTNGGGSAWVAQFQVGSPTARNAGFSFCSSGGKVCHEDELGIVFGNVPSPSPDQSALITEVQARLKSFIWNPNGGPNASGYTNWQKSTTTDTRAIQLGGASGGSPVNPGGCVPGFWGTTLGGTLAFDWEVNSE